MALRFPISTKQESPKIIRSAQSMKERSGSIFSPSGSLFSPFMKFQRLIPKMPPKVSVS